MKRSDSTIESPDEMIGRLLEWYAGNHRELPWRQDREPYHVWISEIMLQQTRVAAVIEYYERFMRELPDVQALAAVDEERLLKLWEGLGYYNRARNLQKAAVMICKEHEGHFPETYEEILRLPGIGTYTAGAIASICFGQATPAVDGNVLRVITRLTGDASCIDLEVTKKKIRDRMVPLYEGCSAEERGKLTQCWMELGATVCVPNGTPLCDNCPLAKDCVARAEDRIAELPVRARKKERRVEERTVFVLVAGDSFALHKRDTKGLLAGLWEFPNVEGRLSMEEALKQAEDWELSPSGPWMELPYTHIFSHVEWHMTAYYILCEKMTDTLDRIEEITWFQRDVPETTAAVPSAFRPFLNLLRKSGENS